MLGPRDDDHPRQARQLLLGIPDEALENLKTVGDAIDFIAAAGVPA